MTQVREMLSYPVFTTWYFSGLVCMCACPQLVQLFNQCSLHQSSIRYRIHTCPRLPEKFWKLYFFCFLYMCLTYPATLYQLQSFGAINAKQSLSVHLKADKLQLWGASHYGSTALCVTVHHVRLLTLKIPRWAKLIQSLPLKCPPLKCPPLNFGCKTPKIWKTFEMLGYCVHCFNCFLACSSKSLKATISVHIQCHYFEWSAGS